ncbi:MAG: LuxR C-terminal-related transcriptional regulator [Actinomycetes bacterium]
MSNKDTAAQCRVSPRTVAFHPRNIFTKPWVTSRGELTQLDPTTAPASRSCGPRAVQQDSSRPPAEMITVP